MHAFLALSKRLGQLAFLLAACVDAYHLTAALLRGYPVLGGLLLLAGGSAVAMFVRAKAGRAAR